METKAESFSGLAQNLHYPGPVFVFPGQAVGENPHDEQSGRQAAEPEQGG
jgi:hypothetical protein